MSPNERPRPPRTEDDPAGDAQLRALLAPHRPEPRTFRAGVAERLRARETGASPSPVAPPSWLRRVAGVLPGLPDLGTATKLWTTVLSLPALVLAASVAAFFHGQGAIGTALQDGAAARGARPAPRWSWAQAVPLLGSLAGFLLLLVALGPFAHHVAELVVLLLVGSMTVLTAQVQQLARAGRADAVAVGGFVRDLLVSGLLGCFVWVQVVGTFEPAAVLGLGGSAAILTAAICATVLVNLARGAERLHSVVTLAILGLLAATNPFGITRATPERVRDQLAGLPLRVDSLHGWETAQAMADALDAAALPRPPLRELRQHVEQAIAAGADAHPLVWTTSAHLGLVPPNQWQALAAQRDVAYRVDRLLADDGPLRLHAYDGWLLHLILATRGLEPAERERLADRIDASWPTAETRFSITHLDRALLCVRWLDLLGRGEIVVARTQDLHALLLRHFVPTDRAAHFSHPGGFASSLEPERRHADVRETGRALALMARVGVPPGLPLDHVRAFLRRQCRISALALAVPEPLLAQEARAHLVRLAHGFAWPPRSVIRFLVDERLALATLLLVTLALQALWLARPAAHRRTTRGGRTVAPSRAAGERDKAPGE